MKAIRSTRPSDCEQACLFHGTAFSVAAGNRSMTGGDTARTAVSECGA